MKNKLIIISILLLSVASCNKKTDAAPETPVAVEQPATEANRECFSFITDKDTVTMTMTRTADNVSGDLVYDWNEKDGNVGTFSGMFAGDTLRMDYTFQSEGMTSVREEVYVRKGNTLVQGTGEVEVEGDRQSFKSRKDLQFGNSIVLLKTECNQ
ncbi:MAG TPA: hypothetical protein VF581_03985 [Flavobacterium sp.]